MSGRRRATVEVKISSINALMTEPIDKRNIVLLSDIEVSKRVIALSEKISSRYNTLFILDGKRFFPHLTLYQAAYPNKNLADVENHLSRLVKNISPFRIYVKNFSTLFGFIFLNVVKSNTLSSLHKDIVVSLNSLREGEMIPADRILLADQQVPEKMKKSVRTYGSALAMEAFMPHITICRLQNPREAKDVLELLGETSEEFEVHGIHLTNIGPHGTVNELFGSFPFNQKK